MNTVTSPEGLAVSTDYERLFRATFEQAPIGIAHVAPDGRWLRINRKLCDIVGYTAMELQQLTFQDITHPEDLKKDLALVGLMLDGHIDTYEMEKRYIRKSGDLVWINLTVSLMRDATGAPDFFISVVEDIQRRKSVEQALRLSEAQFQVIVDNLDVGVISATLDGDLLYWNQVALDMHEFASLDECRLHLADFFRIFEMRTPSGRLLPFSDWPLVRVLGGEVLPGEVYDVRRLDRPQWRRLLSYRGALARDRNGTAMLAMLTLTDVTLQRQREVHYRQAIAMFNHSSEGMAMTDLGGIVLAVNRGFTLLTGYAEEDVVGQNISTIHAQESEPDFDRLLLAALLAAGRWQGSIRSRLKTGEVRAQKVTINTVLDENNNAPVNYVWVLADVGEGG